MFIRLFSSLLNTKTLVFSLTTILISHFILDLQEANRKEVVLNSQQDLNHSSSAVSSVGTINFARHVIGSISASLDHSDIEYKPGDEVCDEGVLDDDSVLFVGMKGELFWEIGHPGDV